MKAIEKTLAAGLLAAACGVANAGGIDFGVADSFSAFVFGNISGGISDVEGRVAVGGNLSQGFDVGYRDAYGSTGPSLVVGGNVSLTSPYGAYGSIYNGPTYAVDTNATIGPSAAPWAPGQLKAGDIDYGAQLDRAELAVRDGDQNHQRHRLRRREDATEPALHHARRRRGQRQLGGRPHRASS